MDNPLPLTDDTFMSLAVREAERAFEEDEIPVGAVVRVEDRVIAKAHNQCELLIDVTAHAEILAITAAQNFLGSKFLNQCTLYVTLEPCVMCAGAVFWSQISRLVIGCRDPKRGYSMYSPPLLQTRTQVSFGMQEGVCSQMLKAYFRSLRKKKKSNSGL